MPPGPGEHVSESPTLPPDGERATSETSTLPPSPPVEALTLPPPSPSGFAAEVTDATLQVDLQAGVLGPYRELELLRPWRYGSIYRAVHPQLRRRVLLRVLAPEHHDTPLRETFLAQARAAAALDHPHVECRIFEAVAYANVVFVAQEQVPSEPLNDFLPREPRERYREGLYPNPALAQALHQAASGLQAIHAAGLAHGHLSAACLRREPGGRACITGLGEEPVEARRAVSVPEVAAGDRVQQDLFDFGGAAAELVTGEPPDLSGDLPPGVLARRLQRKNPGLSEKLAHVLERCLTPDPARRFADAAALVAALEPLTQRENRPAPWGDRVATILYDVLAALVLSGLFAALVFALGSAVGRPEPAPALMAACLVGSPAILLVLEPLLGWSPGRRLRGLRLLAYSGDRPGRLWLLARSLLRWAFLIGAGFALVFLLRLLWPSQPREWMEPKDWEDLGNFVSCVGGALLAFTALYLTSRLTPDGRPLHDFLTGASWYVTRYQQSPMVLVGAERAPAKTTGHDRNGSEPARQASLGERLDQYELQALLGQGGMGAVYLARDTLLQRQVALKVLNGSLQDNPVLARRFEREAQLAAQLSYPNVARVYGVGQAHGKPYMVMEYIDGETLQQRVERTGPLPLARAWEYVRQAALALREAAQLGIVHRDIKPSNLMVTADEVVKVTDFGISRLFAEEEPEHAAAPAATPRPAGATLTRTGALMGTPMYMSPEQARAEKLDPRSDIYSLGLTLHFLLSGQTPYAGTDLFDLVARQCTEEPPSLEGQVDELTPERAGLLRRMIAKDRAARLPSYDELLAELEATAPRPPAPANLTRRFFAEAMNVILLWLAVPALWGVITSIAAARLLPAALPWIRPTAVLFFPLVYLVGIGRYGTTPGKWLLGLQVVGPNGRPVGLWRSFVRYLALYPFWVWVPLTMLLQPLLPNSPVTGMVSGTVTAVGFLVLIVSTALAGADPQGRGLHDRLAGTVVLQLPRTRKRRRRSPPAAPK